MKKGKKNKLIIKIVLLLLAFYVLFLFINQHLKIQSKKAEIQELNNKIVTVKKETEELENAVNGNGNGNPDSKPGTRIFENVLE